MPLPTTFFHAVRMWRYCQREYASRRTASDASMAEALGAEVDGSLAFFAADPAPPHATLLKLVRQCRESQRACAARPDDHNAMIVARYDAGEVDAEIKAIERQNIREQAGDQAHRRQPEPQLSLFGGGG